MTAAPATLSAYRFGGIEVLPAQRVLFLDGNPIYLRPRTYDFLLYLIANRDRVVTKEELSVAVWQNSAVTDNSLVQCVKEIRKALNDEPRQPAYLRTHSKLGYQFIAAVEDIYVEAPGAPVPAASHRRRVRIAAAVAFLGLVAAALVWLAREGALRPKPESRREVAWWTFDGPAATASSPAAPRAQANGSVTQIPGIRGSAAFFAPGAYLSGEDAKEMPSGAAPRTLAAWVKALPNGDHSLIFQYGTRGPLPIASSFALWATDDGRLAAGNKWGGGEVIGATAILDDRWHFVAAVYEGAARNQVRLYVDDRPDGAGPLSHTPATGTAGSWTIGRFLESGTSLRGAIDELRVYRRALSAAEVRALYQCLSCAPGQPFAMPVWPDRKLPAIDAAGPALHLRNTGADFAGIQFAFSTDCALSTARGADLGRDFEIRATLLCPRDPHGYLTQAGPYFRSRRALPGEGILGGSSAGYWVMLHSTGAVKVLSLNPMGVVAFSSPGAAFDDAAWHDLRVRAEGAQLRVWLDSSAVLFDQDRRPVETVRLTAPWTGPPVRGHDEGAIGLSFACWDHSDCQGAQQAKDVVFSRHR